MEILIYEYSIGMLNILEMQTKLCIENFFGNQIVIAILSWSSTVYIEYFCERQLYKICDLIKHNFTQDILIKIVQHESRQCMIIEPGFYVHDSCPWCIFCERIMSMYMLHSILGYK